MIGALRVPALDLVHGPIREDLGQRGDGAGRVPFVRVRRRGMSQCAASLVEGQRIGLAVAYGQVAVPRQLGVQATEPLAFLPREWLGDVERGPPAREREDLRLTLEFVAAEEMRPVAHDRPAKGSA